jgi:archaellum component FlaC
MDKSFAYLKKKQNKYKKLLYSEPKNSIYIYKKKKYDIMLGGAQQDIKSTINKLDSIYEKLENLFNIVNRDKAQKNKTQLESNSETININKFLRKIEPNIADINDIINNAAPV